MTSRLLLLGAGRSASSLIQYLLRHAPAENWFLTVADVNPAHLVPVLAAHTEYARAVRFDLANEAQLEELVSQADAVISMLPATLHLVVARACVRHGRHLATASYVSPEIRALHDEAAAAGVTLLMECGLDPGLDHMSAMRAIAHIRGRGGVITSFKSYCGGLLAPAAEGDNPWKYKFTWNPRNVVLAAHSEYARAVPFDAGHETLLDELVQQADVVISMLPAALHPVVAAACVRHGRHLATASYVSPEVQALHAEAMAAGVTLLM